MKGTEKQIKWAEEIKAATIEAIDQGIVVIRQRMAGHPKAEAVIAKMEGQREALIACDTASDIIDCFSGVKPADPIEKRCAAFAAACNVRSANNDTQRKMLGK